MNFVLPEGDAHDGCWLMAAAVSPPSVCAPSSLVILLCQPAVPPRDPAFAAASKALRAAAERFGATLSVNGRPAVPANSLTHICCSSTAQLQESSPSLWRRHVHSPEKVRGTTTRLVTPEWLWRTVDEEVGPSAAGYDMLASDSQWLSSRTLQQWHASQRSSLTPRQPQSPRAAKRARVDIQGDLRPPRQLDDQTRRKFVVVLMTRESPEFGRALHVCRTSCDPSVYDICFQRDGSRHFTLLTLNGITAAEARRVTLDAQVALPLRLTFSGLNEKSVLLLPDGATKTRLGPLLSRNSYSSGGGGLPSSAQGQRFLHVSLFRVRSRPQGYLRVRSHLTNN